MTPTEFYNYQTAQHRIDEANRLKNKAHLTNIKMHMFSLGVIAGAVGVVVVAKNLPQNNPKHD